EPMSVTAYLVGGASREDVLHGAAVISITDNITGDEQAYWLEALFQHPTDGGKCVGFRLRKFGSAEVYDVPRALDSCTCADATFRPDRPLGCRHQVALRMALVTVAEGTHPRCEHCGRRLEHFEGESYCADCTSFGIVQPSQPSRGSRPAPGPSLSTQPNPTSQEVFHDVLVVLVHGRSVGRTAPGGKP